MRRKHTLPRRCGKVDVGAPVRACARIAVSVERGGGSGNDGGSGDSDGSVGSGGWWRRRRRRRHDVAHRVHIPAFTGRDQFEVDLAPIKHVSARRRVRARVLAPCGACAQRLWRNRGARAQFDVQTRASARVSSSQRVALMGCGFLSNREHVVLFDGGLRLESHGRVLYKSRVRGSVTLKFQDIVCLVEEALRCMSTPQRLGSSVGWTFQKRVVA